MARKKASFSSFIFGLLFGIILTAGSIAYGGYWAYNNLSVNKAEELTGQDFAFLDGVFAADSEMRTYTVSTLITKISAIPGQTFSQISSEYGIVFPEQISFLTDALTDVKVGEITGAVDLLLERVKIGNIFGSPYNDFTTYPVDYAGEIPEGADSLLWDFRTYTIKGENGISTFADTLTIGRIKNILNFTLPEMLSGISDNTLVSELGTAIDSLLIRDLIPAPEITDKSINAVLINKIRDMQRIDSETQVMGYYTLKEFSSLFSAISENIYLRDIIAEPEITDISSNAAIIRALRDMKDSATNDFYTLSNADGLFTNITNELYVKDFIPEQSGDTPTAIMVNELRTKKKVETNDYYKLSQADELFAGIGGDILVSEIIPAPSAESSFVTANLINKIRAMNDPVSGTPYTINNIGALFENITGSLTIQDIMEQPVNDNSVTYTIMNRIWATNANLDNIAGQINTVISGLTIQDIMDKPYQPVLPEDRAATATENIMFKIWNTNATIETLSDAISTAVSSLTIKDLMTEPALDGKVSSKIMHDIWATNSTIENLTVNISDVISNLTIRDFIDEPADKTTVTGKIMYKLWLSDAPINNMASAFENVLNGLELRDILVLPSGGDPDSMSYKMINRLISPKPNVTPEEYYGINELSAALDSLYITDLFSNSTGIFAILDPDGNTKLSDVGSPVVSQRIGNATILQMFNAGLITALPADTAWHNMTLNEIVNNLP